MVDWMRYDYDSLYTGIYCDECYNSVDPDKYTYRKDNYKIDEPCPYGDGKSAKRIVNILEEKLV